MEEEINLEEEEKITIGMPLPLRLLESLEKYFGISEEVLIRKRRKRLKWGNIFAGLSFIVVSIVFFIYQLYYLFPFYSIGGRDSKVCLVLLILLIIISFGIGIHFITRGVKIQTSLDDWSN